MEHVLHRWTGIVILIAQCAVCRPFKSCTVTVKDDTASTMRRFDLTFRCIAEVINDFPVATVASMKNKRCIFAHCGTDSAFRLELVTSRSHYPTISSKLSCCSLLFFGIAFSVLRRSFVDRSSSVCSSKSRRFGSVDRCTNCSLVEQPECFKRLLKFCVNILKNQLFIFQLWMISESISKVCDETILVVEK